MLPANTGEDRERYIVMHESLIGLVRVFVQVRIVLIAENRFQEASTQEGAAVGNVGGVYANNNIEGSK